MEVKETGIKGLYVIEPTIHKDDRGYFYESFNDKEFREKVCDTTFVQDNQSYSTKNVIRGLHYQKPPFEQAKLVRCVKGQIMDVAVDMRPDSETYLQYYGVILSEKNHKQFFIPRGFAHGFVVLTEEAVFQYKCDNFYNKDSEGGIHPFDPSLNIQWLINKEDAILSDKDKNRSFIV